jgi:tRNA nucleotidyltransferase (CCA-adding enzyme)
VLKQITPTQTEIRTQKRVIERLTAALIDHLASSRYAYSFIEPQGSTGRKQTQLRGTADIDLFVGLKPEEFQDILQRTIVDRHQAVDGLMNSLVEECFMPATRHLDVDRVQKAFSQHPFLSLMMEGMEVDILGCFDIDSATLAREGPITAVDRTVHHSRFVTEHLTQKKREDTRILKSFVRACHAYGDTCAVGKMGVTGVALELVVVATSGLDKALKRLVELDTSPLDNSNRTLDELKKIPAFRDDHIFLIDPTDPSRNVASSFTPRSYKWVQYRTQRLREALVENKEKAIMNELIESAIPVTNVPKWLETHCYTHEFKATGQTHYTVLRDKIHRMMKKLQNDLLSERTGEPRFGESLAELVFKNDHYAVGLMMEKPRISATYMRKGPPLHLKNASEEFKAAHEDIKVMEEYLYVEEKREWVEARAMIDRFIQDNPIEGLASDRNSSRLSKQILNVLFRYILPIEPEFSEKITRVKDTQ